jgi:hypothetical protein
MRMVGIILSIVSLADKDDSLRGVRPLSQGCAALHFGKSA